MDVTVPHRSSKERASRAVAVAAASILATVGGAALVFRAEGRMAHDAVGHRLGDRGPDADRLYRPHWGRPLLLAVAGDSVACGLGAGTASATVGAIVAEALADHVHRAVELRTLAEVGARSSDLDAQLDRLGTDVADVVVIVVGGNDLVNHVPLAASINGLREAVTRLREDGTEVVVATCPDFDTLPSLPRPLREFGGQLSRRLAAAQFKAAKAAGARPVLLGKAVREIFLSDPHDMFAIDGFHPSGLGYRRAAAAVIPAVLEAADALAAARE